ncbi:MAG: hypothetical protein ACJAZS_000249 [Alteromonas naphthalenivorans]|jgi:hypothetical protein
MLISKKHLLLNNLSLSIISLLLGYALWQAVSQPYTLETVFQAPLSFYNTEHLSIQAPETMPIRLRGTRKDLYKTIANLAIHYDATQFSEGTHTLKATHKNLFLPDSILLLHYLPIEITVTKT